MREAKALVSLRICADTLEPSLPADAMSTEILSTGVNELTCVTRGSVITGRTGIAAIRSERVGAAASPLARVGSTLINV